MSKLHYRTCHLCETMCGIEIEYDGEQVLAVRGDKNDVLSQGNICPKATGIQDIHTCDDRLRKPIKRVRKNALEKSHDDEWEEVEWDEAIEYAAQGMARIQNQYGKDSLVSVSSRTGQIRMPVIITDDMMPGVVCMPHLWGHNRKNTRQQVANSARV
jgi:anaerobic selenocysteine-containing dehydrogenase